MKIDSWRDLEAYQSAFALQQAIFEVSKKDSHAEEEFETIGIWNFSEDSADERINWETIFTHKEHCRTPTSSLITDHSAPLPTALHSSLDF